MTVTSGQNAQDTDRCLTDDVSRESCEYPGRRPLDGAGDSHGLVLVDFTECGGDVVFDAVIEDAYPETPTGTFRISKPIRQRQSKEGLL